MSVQTTASMVTYDGNGSTSTPYPVPFPFFDASDLLVETLLNGATVEALNLGTQYVVSGGNGSVGEVVTVDALDESFQLRIHRVTPIIQPTSYDNVGRFPARSHERALDRLTYIAQELQRQLNGLRLIDGGTP